MTVVVILIVWEWLVRSGELSALFFPAPSMIVQAFVRLLTSGKLITEVRITLMRALLGLVLGGISGMVLGLLMGWSQKLRILVDPFIAAAHPIPKIAILPLILIIFGIGETSKVIVIAVAAFFPMLINTMAGVRNIHPIHFDVAKNYGASLRKTFSRVIVPGSLPLVLTGLRLAFNAVLLLTIAVELVVAQKGLGRMIWFAWETMRTEELYVGLIVTAALGIGFNFVLHSIAKRLIPWRRTQIE
ncbi:MAG: ABC transporter permease [Gemmatimonadota bacterium]|nr:MAG: ABC transporter permease [Gemmatimonadota bacterium]